MESKSYVVTMEDVIAAYRIAKQHLYRQTSRPRLFKILDFERDLVRNLKAVLSQLNSGKVEKLINECTGFCIVPSRVEGEERRKKSYTLISSDREIGDGTLRKGTMYFRTFSDLPVSSELIFALWMIKVGCNIDKNLPTPSFACGNPVRGRSLYASISDDYVAWQKKISGQIRELLKGGEGICVFLSELRDNVAFSGFKSVETEIAPWSGDSSEPLTGLVSRMLDHWRGSCSQLTSGVPLGSVLERFLINVHLQRVDQKIEHVLRPKYYSRCGTAIAIILPLGKGFSDSKQYNEVVQVVQKGLGIRNQKVSYPDGLLIRTRTRILKLTPASGLDFIDAVDSAVADEDREWEALPELPDSTDEVRRMHTPFGKQNGTCDLLSLGQSILSRRKFVKRLRCMESFAQYLYLGDWEKQRIGFLETVRDSFLDAKSFLEYYMLYPRVLAIAFAATKSEQSREFELAIEILDRLVCYVEVLAKNSSPCGRRKKLVRKELCAYRESLRRTFARSVLECMCAVVMREADAGMIRAALCRRFPTLFNETMGIRRYRDMLCADLTMMSFKAHAVRMRVNGLRDDVVDAFAFPKELLPNLRPDVKLLLSQLWDSAVGGSATGERIPSAFYFATRALDITDVYALLGLPERKGLKQFATALEDICGVHTSDDLPCVPKGSGRYVIVRHWERRLTVKIALVSWLVDMASWTAMVTGDPDDRRCDRFVRLMRLTNRILSLDDRMRPHYLVFPELAMPAEWFLLIARKLAAHGISTIAGVDYIHKQTAESGQIVLEDQVWCALCNSYSPGAHPVIVKYSKSQAAIHEERELSDIANARFDCAGVEQQCRYLIAHGDKHDNVCLSTLICSDLLDIQARARLRGMVDILFVPAWNKDVATYSALVEAASYDIHAYVALCNSREFGDTRLRSPAKNDYERDVVRIKGGLQDFFVVGEVDIAALRRFQSHHHSPERPYKPTPTAFQLVPYRKRRPDAGA